ncbi:hypothetical protein Asppvi_003447 [Aspergillus pseudoviridinutans]|uniref:Ankyrin repeat-containing domain protein n=1 Tax=Aspergillus pseudoviridinutans TaxID=1517512 RepID=A0A9P3BAV2_9EURO|nr:uncharacterized protein Asppvi_003447 [Aspergillus pseudoviridinutans]GIJ84599.1 hypothetical protein Asppvi_003447 [Aspergillus pseudoviridinutans]
MHVNEYIIERYRALGYTDTNIAALTSAQMALRFQVRSKFSASAFPWIQESIEETRDWELYSIYQVWQWGKWHINRALLLGDATHAHLQNQAWLNAFSHTNRFSFSIINPYIHQYNAESKHPTALAFAPSSSESDSNEEMESTSSSSESESEEEKPTKKEVNLLLLSPSRSLTAMMEMDDASSGESESESEDEKPGGTPGRSLRRLNSTSSDSESESGTESESEDEKVVKKEVKAKADTSESSESASSESESESESNSEGKDETPVKAKKAEKAEKLYSDSSESESESEKPSKKRKAMPLSCALESKQTRVIELPPDAYGADIEQHCCKSMTPLNYVTGLGKLELIKLLVDKGASIHVGEQIGPRPRRPLSVASALVVRTCSSGMAGKALV